MQVGRVEHYREDYYQKGKSSGCNSGDMAWGNSGYILVVLIEPNGKAGPVYLLWNLNPPSEDDGLHHTIDEADTWWGYLLGPPQVGQRAVIRIANHIGALQPDDEWVITHAAKRYELVAAFHNPETRVHFRQRVTRKDLE
jgi:hypothetical protein